LIFSEHNYKFMKTKTQSQYEIPPWVRQTAGWWAEGKIPDKEFQTSLQYLVDHGIIKIRN